MAVDDDTSSFSRLSFARLRVRNAMMDRIVISIEIRMEGQPINIRLIEELGQYECKKHSQVVTDEDDDSDWSQFEVKVAQSELGDSGDEEEAEGGKAKGAEVEPVFAPHTFTDVVDNKLKCGPEDGTLMTDNVGISSKKVVCYKGIDFQMINSDDGVSQTHVSNSGGNGLALAQFQVNPLANSQPDSPMAPNPNPSFSTDPTSSDSVTQAPMDGQIHFG